MTDQDAREIAAIAIADLDDETYAAVTRFAEDQYGVGLTGLAETEPAEVLAVIREVTRG